MFQAKLSEDCSSLQTTVNLLKCKLENCQKKLEASEQEVEEVRCQAMEYCNTLEVIMYNTFNIYDLAAACHTCLCYE